MCSSRHHVPGNRFNPGDCLLPKNAETWEVQDKFLIVKKVGAHNYLLEQKDGWYFKQATVSIKDVDNEYVKIECPEVY